MLILYTTQATALGGRSGSAASAVKRLRVELSTPQALGGDNGPGTNPEQLFAAGYAGSLLSSIRTVAKLEKIAISHDSNVTAAIGIGPIGTGGGLALALGEGELGAEHAKGKRERQRSHRGELTPTVRACSPCRRP